MEYTIQELSRLSGVTSRALRWYDRIGLLKPLRVTESGYRCYGPAEVNRLQDILYYRALGVELSAIRDYLDAPDFDRIAALRGHLAALQEKKSQLSLLIQSVEETIRSEERNEIMSDKKKFEAFKRQKIEENEAQYGKEARKTYGDEEVDRANTAFGNLTVTEAREWESLDQEIRSRLEEAIRSGSSPDSAEGRELTALHLRWLTLSMGSCDRARQRGIAELYVLDERFTAYYDRNISGCALFLRDAVRHWA